MKKKERIAKYGQIAWEKNVQLAIKWQEEHQERVKTNQQKHNRKGGKYYEKKRRYDATGLRREKNLIRYQHNYRYYRYKQIIASNSQIHHEWIPNTSKYRGLALVEQDQHLHGFVDVIQILEGEITLLTEAEISGRLGLG